VPSLVYLVVASRLAQRGKPPAPEGLPNGLLPGLRRSCCRRHVPADPPEAQRWFEEYAAADVGVEGLLY